MTTDHIPPISDETLAELLELEAKATPGEWTRPEDSECIVTGLKEKRGGYMRYESQICTMSGESEVSADELFDHYYNGDVVRDEGGDPLDLSKLSVGDRAAYNWMWDGDLIAKSRNSLRSIVRELQERRAAEKKEISPIVTNGYHDNRLLTDFGSKRETAFAEQWVYEHRYTDVAAQLVCLESGKKDPSLYVCCDARDRVRGITTGERRAIATIVQWLGSNVGWSFLEQALRRCGFYIARAEKE